MMLQSLWRSILSLTILLMLCILSCKPTADQQSATTEVKQKAIPVGSNTQLKEKLSFMAEQDQIAAFIPMGKYKDYSPAKWKTFKDSVFSSNKEKLEIIFKDHGYPGYDLVGKEGESNFWVMVQHCDFDPNFQGKVLKKQLEAVKKDNADPANYAYLKDRVLINTGRKQIYGTQIMYDRDNGQALPQSLDATKDVDELRSEIGLESLKDYLNMMTLSHFEMNKNNFESRGIFSDRNIKKGHLSITNNFCLDSCSCIAICNYLKTTKWRLIENNSTGCKSEENIFLYCPGI
jgi:hypothetical protein